MCTKLRALLPERGGCITGPRRQKAVAEIEFACLWGIVFSSQRCKDISLNYRYMYSRELIFIYCSLLRSFMPLCFTDWVNNLQ